MAEPTDAPKSKPKSTPRAAKPKAAKPAAPPATAPAPKPAPPKATAPKAAAPKASGKAAQGAATGSLLAAYDIVFHPVVTEKTMFALDKNNSLEFLVHPRATKPEITKAIEVLFSVKVAKVTTRHTREGKRATVRFAEGYSAEDVGTRIGVF